MESPTTAPAVGLLAVVLLAGVTTHGYPRLMSDTAIFTYVGEAILRGELP